MDRLDIAITQVEILINKTKKSTLFTTEILKLVKKVNFDKLSLLDNAKIVNKFASEVKKKTGRDKASPSYWENYSRYYLMETLSALINLKLGDDSYFERILNYCVKSIAHYHTFELAKQNKNSLTKEELRLKLVGYGSFGGYQNFIRIAKHQQNKFLSRFHKTGRENENQNNDRR